MFPCHIDLLREKERNKETGNFKPMLDWLKGLL